MSENKKIGKCRVPSEIMMFPNAVEILQKYLPEQMSEELHKKIPDSRLEILDMAGHFAPAQRKEIINQLICDFINKLK